MWLVFSIISCILASIMQLLNKKAVSNIDPFVVTILKNGMVFLISLSLLFSKKVSENLGKINKKEIILIIILSVVCFLTYFLFYIALKNGPLNKALAIDRFSIVIVFFYLWFTRQEKVGFFGFIGSILVFIGIVLIMIKK